MRRSKEIMILLALFVAMAAGTLWYVIDRRAKNRAQRPATTHSPAPASAASGSSLLLNDPVVMGTQETERKTIDFSTGQPVIKDSPEDQAALEAGLRDIEEAKKDVTFEAPKK